MIFVQKFQNIGRIILKLRYVNMWLCSSLGELSPYRATCYSFCWQCSVLRF
jgi:hypothetical protein